MKHPAYLSKIFLATIIFLAPTALLNVTAQTIDISFSGDTAVIDITNPTRYLILPIEEDMPEAQVLLDNGRKDDTWMDIRLAQNKTDYCVPFALSHGDKATVRIANLPKDAAALKNLQLSDSFDISNTDYYRPLYHHTPVYGWMNDANGMVYKDGVYHLYFQYNPYGSKWGNMHWGHSVSPDMVHWTHLQPAIERDTLGHIFSGSSVVDKNNDAGFGRDAIVAFYTSHKEVMKDGQKTQRQVQCMAYSIDGGNTFTKYEGNPVVTPSDGLKDFRDPKVFWYEEGKAWYMIVSADKEMRFYKSSNLKDWTYVSAFGKGYGAQPNQFECPDFFPMTLNGKQKWVMIVNINPGCLFGGSATEYFVGDFDGKEFKCETAPKVAKFLDYGKDHYATVTWSNTDNRVLALAWVSNWQYANLTPIKQYRGQNSLPRELKLFKTNGQTYLAATVPDEVKSLRQSERLLGNFTLADGNQQIRNLFDANDGAFEIEADITPDKDGRTEIDLYNAKCENTKIYFDLKAGKVVMDRTESGQTKFGEQVVPHDIEREYDIHEHRELSNPVRKANAINYVNDFALATWAPLSLCEGKTFHVDIYVDKCSIELFVDGGRIAMTNLVFPSTPYNNIAMTGSGSIDNMKAYKLGY